MGKRYPSMEIKVSINLALDDYLSELLESEHRSSNGVNQMSISRICNALPNFTIGCKVRNEAGTIGTVIAIHPDRGEWSYGFLSDDAENSKQSVWIRECDLTPVVSEDEFPVETLELNIGVSDSEFGRYVWIDNKPSNPTTTLQGEDLDTVIDTLLKARTFFQFNPSEELDDEVVQLVMGEEA